MEVIRETLWKRCLSTPTKPPPKNSNICVSETAYQHKGTMKKCKKTNQAAIIQWQRQCLMDKLHRKPSPKSKISDISKQNPSPLHHTFFARTRSFHRPTFIHPDFLHLIPRRNISFNPLDWLFADELFDEVSAQVSQQPSSKLDRQCKRRRFSWPEPVVSLFCSLALKQTTSSLDWSGHHHMACCGQQEGLLQNKQVKVGGHIRVVQERARRESKLRSE